jgi:hypothetical protein
MAKLTAEGKPAGFLPAFAEALADRLDRPLRVLPYSRAELYTSLERGEADLVLDPAPPPPGLVPHLALAGTPWATAPYVALAPAEIRADLKKLPYFPTQAARDQLNQELLPYDLQLLTPPGSPLGRTLRQAYPIFQHRPVADLREGLAEVLRAGGIAKDNAARQRPATPPEGWPCLILPLREALLLNRQHPRETAIIGHLAPREDWFIAMSRDFAARDREKLDAFMQSPETCRKLHELQSQHLPWDLEALPQSALPNYLTCPH